MAWYQSITIADIYTTLGYLVTIITILSVPIVPRAKYIQTLMLNITGICIGSATALLGIWSGIKAREHTTPAGSNARYNSSQAAVCAIWLFANIYFANVMRAKMPPLQFPVIVYSIFTNSLGDEQCFIIPLRANQGRKSGWTIEFRSQGMVTWTNNRLGILSGDWQTARWTGAIIKKDQHHEGTMLHSAALEPIKYESETTEVNERLALKE